MKHLISIIITLLFSVSTIHAQTELISGWRLHSIGTSKQSKTEVNYEAAAALILQNPSTVLLQIIDKNGNNLGPIIELKSYSIDDDYITSNAFAITSEAILRDNKTNPLGNYTIFIQMDENKRDVLRFSFHGNPLYLEGRLTQEKFIDYLVNLSSIGTVLQSGGRLKVPMSKIIFGN